MASEQSMKWAKMQAGIEAEKAAIMTVRETETPAFSKRSAPAMPKTGGPVLKQHRFDLKSPGKYIELCIFEIKE